MSIVSRRTFAHRAASLTGIAAISSPAVAGSPIGETDPELAALVAQLHEARARMRDSGAREQVLVSLHERTNSPEDYQAILDFEDAEWKAASGAAFDAETALIMAIRARGERPGSGQAAVVGDRLIVDVRAYGFSTDEEDPESPVLEIPLANVAGLPADLDSRPIVTRTPHPTPEPIEAIIPGNLGNKDTGPLSFRRVRAYSPEVWRATPPDDRPKEAIKAGFGGARLVIEEVPRWEVPEVCRGPQPRPITCVVGGGINVETIERRWLAEDVKHCRLCAQCSMSTWGGPLVECTVDVPKGLLPDDQDEADRIARLWSMRYNAPLDGVAGLNLNGGAQ